MWGRYAYAGEREQCEAGGNANPDAYKYGDDVDHHDNAHDVGTYAAAYPHSAARRKTGAFQYSHDVYAVFSWAEAGADTGCIEIRFRIDDAWGDGRNTKPKRWHYFRVAYNTPNFNPQKQSYLFDTKHCRSDSAQLCADCHGFADTKYQYFSTVLADTTSIGRYYGNHNRFLAESCYALYGQGFP